MTPYGNKQWVWLGIGLFGISIVVAILSHDMIGSGAANYGDIDRTAIIGGIIIGFSGLFLFVCDRYRIYERNGILSLKVYVEALVVLVSVISIGVLGLKLTPNLCGSPTSEGQWAIGIYSSSSNEPLDFDGGEAKNPVLTAGDVTDIEADFVADPFFVHYRDDFFMFFEVLNKDTKQGDIGMARSTDGLNWKYEKIVLDESFHMSYPYVFEWEGIFYMIPQTDSASVRLYKAENFPYNWSFVKNLLEGQQYLDSSIVFYDNMWWLFSGTGSGKDTVLRLYFAEALTGPWHEHPSSPIVKNDNDISRPGGRVVVFGNRIIRYAQDDDPYYGNQVWAIEVTMLTTTTYAEKKALSKPILKGYENWNTRGMHTLAPILAKNGTWIATVDGN